MPPAPSAVRHRLRRAGVVVAAAAALPLLAGCGSTSIAKSPAPVSTTPAPATPAPASTTSSSTTPATATATTATGRKLTVAATEYAFAPMAVAAKAGKLTITLDNKGKMPHELVVLKTSAAAGSLSVKSGRVSESRSVGEVSETAAGATKSTTLKLKAGSYVFVCNIPGHYADGMRGTLTVR